MDPIVSIIIPFYNCEKFFEETIRSVLAQNFLHWELILVNDESTDSSRDIALRFCKMDGRVKLIEQKNGGQGKARNLGIQNASSRIIAFLDADDVWVTNKLEIQLSYFHESNSPFIYSLGYYIKEEDGNSIQPYTWKIGRFTSEHFFLILSSSNHVTPSTVLISKELLNRVGGFDESSTARGSEDFDLWMKIACVKGVFILGLDERLVYYRIHSGGEHKLKKKQLQGKLYVYQKYLTENSTSEIRNAIIPHYRYFYKELLALVLNNNDKNESLILLNELYFYDSHSLLLPIQVLLLKVFSPKVLHVLSSKVLNRIGGHTLNLFRRFR